MSDYNREEDVLCCPICRSVDLRKNGKTRTSQIWLCKTCGKKFHVLLNRKYDKKFLLYLLEMVRF